MDSERNNQKNTWVYVFCIILAVLFINEVLHTFQYIKTTTDIANHSVSYKIGWVSGILLKPFAILYMLLFLLWKFILKGTKNRPEN